MGGAARTTRTPTVLSLDIYVADRGIFIECDLSPSPARSMFFTGDPELIEVARTAPWEATATLSTRPTSPAFPNPR